MLYLKGSVDPSPLLLFFSPIVFCADHDAGASCPGAGGTIEGLFGK